MSSRRTGSLGVAGGAGGNGSMLMPPPPPPSPGAPLGAEFMNMSWSAHLSPLPPLFMGGIGLFGATGDDGSGMAGGNGGPLSISIDGTSDDVIDADPIIERTTVTSSGGLGDWSGRIVPPPPPSPDPVAAAIPVLNGGTQRMGGGTRATGAAVTWTVAPPHKGDRVSKVKDEAATGHSRAGSASPGTRKRRARVARMAAGTACVVCHTQKTKCDGRRYSSHTYDPLSNPFTSSLTNNSCGQRPCGRCVRLHREERCVDREGKHSHHHHHDSVKTEKVKDVMHCQAPFLLSLLTMSCYMNE
jgi:hypothetical protein